LNAQPHNLAPKVGFAFTPGFSKQKLVMRGGFAMAYNHLDIALFNNALEDGPGVANFGLCCAGNGGSQGVKYEKGTSTSPSSFPINPRSISASTLPLDFLASTAPPQDIAL